MTGPEHYAEAERLLRMVDIPVTKIRSEAAAGALSAAQVHATLALAAATVAIDGNEMPHADWNDWRVATHPVETS